MSGPGTKREDGDEIVSVNIKLSESLLADIEDTWQGRDFNTRSEFIRDTLHDAVEFPTFDRDELIALLKAEQDIQRGKTIDREEIRDRFDAAVPNGE